MKINLDSSKLWQCVSEMGADRVHHELFLGGIKNIDPDEITVKAGLLSIEGYQIVVYIPDHSYKGVDAVQINASEGNRYHFAECQTITEMKAKGKYESRYTAVHNPDGKFEIFDNDHHDITVPLLPCQNCFKHINYNDFKYIDRQQKRRLVETFQLEDLFTAYSTIFLRPPILNSPKGSYAENWDDISREYRQSRNYCCESCQVNLQTAKHLLHTHHINGNKLDNNPSNLQALCADCHRKQADHSHIYLSYQDMKKINLLRRAQGLIKISSWDDVLRFSDRALHGLIYEYRQKAFIKLPDEAYELKDEKGQLLAYLDLAWTNKKVAITVDEREAEKGVKLGWNVKSIAEAFDILKTK